MLEDLVAAAVNAGGREGARRRRRAHARRPRAAIKIPGIAGLSDGGRRSHRTAGEGARALPGIGEKTAQRLAFHILKAGPEYAGDLAARDRRRGARRAALLGAARR